jgi:hypothetical protein
MGGSAAGEGDGQGTRKVEGIVTLRVEGLRISLLGVSARGKTLPACLLDEVRAIPDDIARRANALVLELDQQGDTRRLGARWVPKTP